MTKEKLIEELNKKSQECSMLSQKNISLENTIAIVSRDNIWLRRQVEDLILTMKNGASECIWPRRTPT